MKSSQDKPKRSVELLKDGRIKFRMDKFSTVTRKVKDSDREEYPHLFKRKRRTKKEIEADADAKGNAEPDVE